MDAFRVLKTQFQTFINSRFSFNDDDGLMIRKYFLAYTQTEVQQFRDTLTQYKESVKKSIDERALHKREHDIKVNEREMQTKKGKADSSKALDVGLVVIDSNGTKSDKQDTSSRSGKDADTEDADIRLVNDQEPLVEVQLTAPIMSLPMNNNILCNLNPFMTHPVRKENEKLHKENEHLKQTYKDLYDSIKKTRVQTKDHNESLTAQINRKNIKNANLKAQIQEKVFANVALKNELRKLKENRVDTKFAKPSILRKPVLQSPRNQSVVRQLNTFKFE
nr:hypothetical protein [Tanacetum cinerariifolium]GEZ28773.1 hypothetical protein [Tanacetum cinerariifolium]